MTYRVARADLRLDREEILSLWERHLPQLPFKARHYDWAYLNNPFSEGRIWKLTQDGHTVGVAGLVMRRISVAGKSALAGRLGGLAVAEEHQFLGPALRLMRAVLAECGRDELSLIYTCAPHALTGMSLRAGFNQVADLTRYVKILDVTPSLGRRVPFPRAARWLARPANLVLRSAAAVGRRPVVVNEVEQFDSRFDDLWRRAAPNYPLTSERTATFLNWRFHDFPLDVAFTTIGVSHPADGRLLGYGTCVINDGIASLVDLFAEDTGAQMHDVLSAVTGWLRAAGATSIVMRCAGAETLHRSLRQGGFHPRPDEQSLTVMTSPRIEDAHQSAQLRASQLYFLPADDFWQ